MSKAIAEQVIYQQMSITSNLIPHGIVPRCINTHKTGGKKKQMHRIVVRQYTVQKTFKQMRIHSISRVIANARLFNCPGDYGCRTNDKACRQTKQNSTYR